MMARSRFLSAALGLLLPFAGVPTAVLAQDNGIIVVPLGPDAPGFDDEAIGRLTRERLDAERARGTPAEQAAPPPQQISPLRPVDARGQPQGSAIRFGGESRDLEFALFVPDPSQVQTLRLSTMSSINVLPERSDFRVHVNDHFVGGGRLAHFTDYGATNLTLAPGVLTAGHNRVRIGLDQYHRIFCGPEASFALWSDIDLATSGAVIEGGAAQDGARGFLMGLALAAASGNGIEIRGSAGLGEQRAAWVELVTRRLTAAMGGDPVPFRFTDYWTLRGDGPAGGRVTFLPAANPATGQRVSFRTGGDGAPVMVIEYAPGQPPPQAVPELDAALPALPPRPAPALIATNRPVPFADFGFESVEVRDRYALIEQRFRLPDDYVVLTNAKAEIRLDYIYAEDLPAGAMLLVHINGHNIRLLPLRGAGGRMIEQFPVRFEARHLRAGTNTLAFEVLIPGEPAELPCPGWDRPALAIGAASTLQTPYSPSMYLPDMHFAFRALTAPGLRPQAHAARAFSENDVIALRAALAGSVVSGAADPVARLHLLSLEDLASLPLGGHTLSRHAIEDVLLGGPLGGSIGGAPAPEGLDGSLLRLTGEGGMRRPPESLPLWERAQRLFQDGLQWIHPRSGTLLEQWLGQQRGQAILLQLDPARSGEIWLLRAPGADTGALASAIVAARTASEGPRGQVSVLDAEGRWRSWIAPDRQPVLLESVTLRNLRHVLGNLVSAMPIRYVMVLFLLALIAALVALRLVISTREHQS